MKYLLSQEEYDELVNRGAKREKELEATLQELCTRVADSELVKEGWYAGRVWGCILTKKEEWYCDDCPVNDVCPHRYKEWSK
jgi:endonuclease III